ncbi:MAG: hypothetical protein COV75_07810 [Candidatus Omnitrophica bacterium CG11_big_fil_rev_8_21_14_0_20_63_9]|nr:MAG: hypothetical protein COV75_07810 [Candidatus Omnitrophica bacterium CG11_big_fil_rev_8_21_14_0_20_63_9]
MTHSGQLSGWQDAWFDGVRHACFDKDGVLINVHRYWRHTTRLRAQHIQRRFELKPECLDGLAEAMGIDERTGRIRPEGPVGLRPRSIVIESLQRFLAAQGVKTSADALGQIFADLDEEQRRHQDYDVAVLPGVGPVLDSLKRRGIMLSLYTSDRKEHAHAILARASLDAYFATLVGGGCVTHPKPDPEGFVLACQRVNVKPADSVYISDTAEDLRMGLAGGARKVIGVASGLGTVEALLDVTPHVCQQLGG